MISIFFVVAAIVLVILVVYFLPEPQSSPTARAPNPYDLKEQILRDFDKVSD